MLFPFKMMTIEGSHAGTLDEEARNRGDFVAIPTIQVAFALSLLLHIAVLWGPWSRQLRFPSFDNPERGTPGGSLIVQLSPSVRQSESAPAAAPAHNPAPRAQSSRSQATPPAKAPVHRRPAPALAAVNRPAPDARHLPGVSSAPPSPSSSLPSSPPSAAPSVVTPAPSGPLGGGDLASYVEAHRRARELERETSQSNPSSALAGREGQIASVESEQERNNRIVADKLGLRDTPTFGDDPRHGGGGVFQIQRMGFDDAEFVFFGWDKDIRRNSRQVIEARKGDAGDIRLAVIRKMIAIIREQEPGDFIWVSRRLGRDVTLSAAPEDNAGLEDFLMREFFGDPRAPQ